MTTWRQPNHVAVITGGASGIGLAAAANFIGEGMRVCIADLNEAALDAATQQLEAPATHLLTVACDVGDHAQVIALRDEVLETFGRVDLLMNNAGAGLTRAVPWDDVEGWKRQLDVNLWGVVHGCQAFIPLMLEANQPAAVINTGSKQGITNPPSGYAYNLSKAGVVNYTQSVAHALRDLDGCQVTAHLLVPGFTYSNMIARFVPEKPAGAWHCEQVIEYMLERLEENDFYIICPDGDTPRALDNKRMQWAMDDLVHNRPALSRWHPDYAAHYEAFVNEE